MQTLIDLVTTLIDVYAVTIIIYVILGYFPETRKTKIYEILYGACEPFVKIFDFAKINFLSFAPILSVICLQLLNTLIREIYL